MALKTAREEELHDAQVEFLHRRVGIDEILGVPGVWDLLVRYYEQDIKTYMESRGDEYRGDH